MTAPGEQQQSATLLGSAPATAADDGTAAAAAAATAAAAAAAEADARFEAEVKEGRVLLRQVFDALDAGKQADEEVLRGVPGVRLEAMGWGVLAELIGDGSAEALGQLGRSPRQIKHYYDQRDDVILREFASVTDYLHQRVFGFPVTAAAPDGRKKALVPDGFFEFSCCDDGDGSGDGSGSRLVTVWRDNDFPYHLQPGIEHFNLWANRPLSQAQVERAISAHVPSPGQCETLWFVNPPALMSVPTIWHAHVLVRRRRQQQQQRLPGGQQQQHGIEQWQLPPHS